MEALEKEVEELAERVAIPLATRPGSWLVGWAEISAFCRRPERTLSRYMKLFAFPAYRLGGHVISHPAMINDWLRAAAAAKAAKKKDLTTYTDTELQRKLKKLEAKLSDNTQR